MSEENVPAELLTEGTTSSLELVLQSVLLLLKEAVERLEESIPTTALPQESTKESVSQAFHSTALASASDATAHEKSQAVEDARSKVTKMWGAEQLDYREKVQDLQGTDKGGRHNKRSALTHVIADELRATAVMVVAVISLCHSDSDMNVADAWVALVLSVLIIGGSGWSQSCEVGALLDTC